jgi:hypothetical protein
MISTKKIPPGKRKENDGSKNHEKTCGDPIGMGNPNGRKNMAAFDRRTVPGFPLYEPFPECPEAGAKGRKKDAGNRWNLSVL